MTLSKDSISSDTAMEARISDQNLKASHPFPLRKLPLEVRRKIYWHYLVDTRNPSAKIIYLTKLNDDWRDPPSPLLLVNSQVRAEILDLVKKWPINIRVTHQGIHFNSLAETCFIAQPRSRDYGSIPHLVIDIWPPHPDRPTDLIDIWRHLRKLRAELIAIPLLQRLTFFFAENEMATWTYDGKALDIRHPHWLKHTESRANDVTYIANLFGYISATRARFNPPRGLKPGEPTEQVRTQLRNVSAMMMGLIPPVEDAYSEDSEERAYLQDDLDFLAELRLQTEGAKIARNKLDAMTNHGRVRLTPERWEDFIAVWSPHFGNLTPDEFKGKKHYVYMDDP